MKKRGSLARILDLATEKVALMTEFNVASEKEMKRACNQMRVLKVKFLQICEQVKFNKRRLEAKTAFITFDSEEGYERCRKAYVQNDKERLRITHM